MYFTDKKNIRVFYIHGASEVDIYQNSEGKFEVPAEVFQEHSLVYFEKSNGEIQPVEPEDIDRSYQVQKNL
jgi:hypothetical protein